MPTNSPAPEPVPSRHPSGARSRRALLGGSLAVVALVVVFGLLFAYLRAPRLTALAGGQTPKGWQTYRDPAGAFTIRIPPEWRATVSTGESTMGNNSGSFSSQDEYVELGTSSNLLLGTGVGIDVEPLPNAFARQWTCQSGLDSPNTTIGGWPATSGSWTWFLDTNAAHYQISTSFPGGGSPHSSPAMPAGQPLSTPVPQATVTASEQLITLVVSTFRPIPATPLSCS
ncbi:MAG: hypothetical protein ACRDHP_04365 [Ktedonobacterales bacterium]